MGAAAGAALGFTADEEQQLRELENTERLRRGTAWGTLQHERAQFDADQKRMHDMRADAWQHAHAGQVLEQQRWEAENRVRMEEEKRIFELNQLKKLAEAQTLSAQTAFKEKAQKDLSAAKQKWEAEATERLKKLEIEKRSEAAKLEQDRKEQEARKYL